MLATVRAITDSMIAPLTRTLLLLTESGLWRVLLLTSKPVGIRLRDRLDQEILPSLRKTGSFALPGALPALPGPALALVPSFVLQLAQSMKAGDIERLTALAYDKTLPPCSHTPLRSTDAPIHEVRPPPGADLLAAFLADCCERRADAHTTNTALYARFAAFCTERGEEARSHRWLTQALQGRGFRQESRRDSERRWRGLGLREVASSGALETLVQRLYLRFGAEPFAARQAVEADAPDLLAAISRVLPEAPDPRHLGMRLRLLVGKPCGSLLVSTEQPLGKTPALWRISPVGSTAGGAR